MTITKEVLDELLKDCHGPDDFYGHGGLVKQLSKAIIERMMQAELTEQLGYEKNQPGEKQTENRRNRKSTKTLRTDQGPMDIAVPRDRDGEFEPKAIPKHQREWRGFDDKILAMYSYGMSTQGIQATIKDMYNVDISPELVSRVTDEAKGMADEWRNSPLEPFFPVMFFDAHGIPLLRILTDRGSEYCGNREHHEYALYLDIENIEHSRTKAKSPQTNGICERFNKTCKDEFYSIAFRKKISQHRRNTA
jgi:hypothetical protein